MSADQDRQIDRIAAAQHGLVTRAQARGLGIASSTIARRLRAARWLRIAQGVYRVRGAETPLEWAQRVLLMAGPRSWLSHDAAATLLGWRGPEPYRSPAPVDVSIDGGGRRRRPGLRVHRVGAIADDERAVRHGLRVTSPLRTLIDLAATRPLSDLERTVARAQRANRLTPEDLHRAVERYSGRRGIRALRVISQIEGGPALTRSEAEVRFLELVRDGGLPPPRANARIGPWECDCVWPRERIVVEIDGYDFHRGRRMFEHDREKDSWLRSRGYTVVRFSWRQLHDRPIKTVVELARTLTRAM